MRRNVQGHLQISVEGSTRYPFRILSEFSENEFRFYSEKGFWHRLDGKAQGVPGHGMSCGTYRINSPGSSDALYFGSLYELLRYWGGDEL